MAELLSANRVSPIREASSAIRVETAAVAVVGPGVWFQPQELPEEIHNTFTNFWDMLQQSQPNLQLVAVVHNYL